MALAAAAELLASSAVGVTIVVAVADHCDNNDNIYVIKDQKFKFCINAISDTIFRVSCVDRPRLVAQMVSLSCRNYVQYLGSCRI